MSKQHGVNPACPNYSQLQNHLLEEFLVNAMSVHMFFAIAAF